MLSVVLFVDDGTRTKKEKVVSQLKISRLHARQTGYLFGKAEESDGKTHFKHQCEHQHADLYE